MIYLTTYLVTEHLNYILRSVTECELSTGKEVHFVNRTYSGNFFLEILFLYTVRHKT